VEGNINRANELLKKGKHISLDGQTSGIGIGIELLHPDILVLPELALTGMYMSCLRTLVTLIPSCPVDSKNAWPADRHLQDTTSPLRKRSNHI
jgi:protein N-terminal amidase